MRPLRHSFPAGLDHDDMIATHVQPARPHASGYYTERPAFQRAPGRREWGPRIDLRFYGPGYYANPGYYGGYYGQPGYYDPRCTYPGNCYPGDWVQAGPEPTPPPDKSRLHAILYGFGGMLLVAAGALGIVAGLGSHNLLAAGLGGVGAAFGLGLVNSAMKVTDP